MSRRTIEYMVCDRCGHGEDYPSRKPFDPNANFGDWATVCRPTRENNGTWTLRTASASPMHICPSCWSEIKAMFEPIARKSPSGARP